MLPECYPNVTRMLPECYPNVARMLPECCPNVARMLPECCPNVARMLPYIPVCSPTGFHWSLFRKHSPRHYTPNIVLAQKRKGKNATLLLRRFLVSWRFYTLGTKFHRMITKENVGVPSVEASQSGTRFRCPKKIRSETYCVLRNNNSQL